MLSLILIAAFVLCLAMAVAAILIGHQFISTYDTAFHKHYFYYLAAFYAFSVYGLWGQILARMLLSSIDAAPGVVETVADFMSMLGVPMLFVSWLMLINMAHSMFGSTLKPSWLSLHALVFVLLLLGSWIAFDPSPGGLDAFDGNVRIAVIVALDGVELAYFTAFLLIVARLGRHEGRGRGRFLLRFAALMAGAFVLRGAMLPLAYLYPGVAMAVPLYFGSNLIPLFYLRANTDRVFVPVRAESASEERMNRLFEQCGITKRERQIVREICLGKTNQQIADELFISLQTVKDHTHRIYSKVGVRSRIQLVHKVGG